ncbi:MAG: hypothetical protein DMG56_08740 [Acidobacteria bacterium]|nr:MAG: hypothetical protein DMG41_39245 [Acidobacteriota bacterium]PYU39828.1 MAG: hypothetical protein DMG53_23790 [Acidobacteriota bacterium]PYU41484.1 MAG: hypothetical protein DMG54_19495 [Acidobacteriota bacterium]PYU63723.1 MAG: hypothetical protein DMG56_08740 [Acidobacteriota bacterium]PYU73071.1 MAG: hypothetical protein DMG52_16295 [Acidobacteriota bacterium]
MLSGISSWSCSVRAVFTSSASIGLIVPCGFGSHGCGTIGVRQLLLVKPETVIAWHRKAFRLDGDGRVVILKDDPRYPKLALYSNSQR